jgi:hypothetical protein
MAGEPATKALVQDAQYTNRSGTLSGAVYWRCLAVCWHAVTARCLLARCPPCPLVQDFRQASDAIYQTCPGCTSPS